MASRGSGFDRNHSFIGNFSVLEGVMVKISDKFRPPKKVSLPAGWQPVEVRAYEEFDFTFEEKVIMMADQEKLQQERESENLKVAELIQETQCEQLLNEDTSNDLVADIGDIGSGGVTQALKTETVSDIREAPILEPVRIQQDVVIAKRDINKQKDFNFSEFEDNSATPFELVELQTLDDIDELKSVLQPQCPTNTKSTGSERNLPSRKADDDIDFSIFCTPVTASVVETSTNSPVATASLLEGLEAEDSHFSQNAVSHDVVYQNTPHNTMSWSNSGLLPARSNHTYNESSVNSTATSGSSAIPLEGRFERNSFRLANSRSSYSNRFSGTINSAAQISPTIASVYPVQAPSQSGLPVMQNSSFPAQQYQSQTRWKSQEKLAALEWGSNDVDPVCNNSEVSFIKSTQTADQKALHEYETNSFGFEKTSLNRASSKSLPNLAEASLMTNDDPQTWNQWKENQRKSPIDFATPVVSTSRIDNIMKQFQLDRLREFDETSNRGTGTHSDQMSVQDSIVDELGTRPLSRHGTLPPLQTPPLQTSPHSVPYHPSTSPHLGNNFRTQNTGSDKQYLSDDESSRGFRHLEPLLHKSNVKKKQGSNRERNLSLSEPLPAITTQTPSTSQWKNPVPKQEPSKQGTGSWLPDPFTSLSTTEKTFVTMVAGMGFPKARAARAVLRVKNDEKEIIDFLVRVQQIAELGFDEDDAELALIDNKNDKEKALNYLNLVNKWKELGFPVQKIHKAMTHTDRENEAVFEYLTT